MTTITTLHKLIFIAILIFMLLHLKLMRAVEKQNSSKNSISSLYLMQSNTTGIDNQERSQHGEYTPSPIESYIMDNMERLGWDEENITKMEEVEGCSIWKDKKVAPQIYDDLHSYHKELQEYHSLIKNFKPLKQNNVKSIRKNNNHDICKSTRLYPDGGNIETLFPSQTLSHLPKTGFAEPLVTPMRHPNFCFDENQLPNMTYMVFDFEKMCQNLKPHSQVILFDMGASLQFYTEEGDNIDDQPILYLIRLFEKFGFYFDHIYGYEITPQDPEVVFKKLLPKEYMASYHWINAGVSPEEGNKLNPLDAVLRQYDEDDLILVKLDVDNTPTELPLAKQLLEDESLHKLVDHFFFEHHVLLGELDRWWYYNANDSIKSSFELFQGMRKKGVSSHFWV